MGVFKREKAHWAVLAVCSLVIWGLYVLFSRNILTTDIVPYGLAVFVVAFLALWLGCYIDRIKGNDCPTWETCVEKDITSGLKRIFSLDGLFVIIVLAVVAVVIFLMLNAEELSGKGETELLLISLTVTLSTLIPTMISKIVAKNQLNEAIETKMEAEMSKFAATLYDIRRDKGHASRMSAALLEQIAESKTTEVDRQNREDNAAWAIGWASNAIISYLLIRDRYANALENSASCINILNKAANLISAKSPVCRIKKQDLKSLLTMHALIDQFELDHIIETKAKLQRAREAYEPQIGGMLEYNIEDLNLISSLGIVEEHFYMLYLQQGNKRIDFSHFCTVTGMPHEFNEKLNDSVARIANRFKHEVESKK